MNQGDFWNDQEKAQATINEYRLLKSQIDGLEEVIRDFEDASLGIELAREAEPSADPFVEALARALGQAAAPLPGDLRAALGRESRTPH